MRELDIPRAEIESAIRDANFADGWLFEFHAVSTGAPADVQYLTTAENCDLLVLIIGSEMSTATRDEYLRAYGDNPDKILAFYVGAGGDEVADFRSLIDSRHSRTQLEGTSGLAEAVLRAIETAIANGRVTFPSLRRMLLERIAEADRLIALDPALAFVPCVFDPSTDERIRLHALWRREPRIVLVDIGGAGKTYGALAALFTLGNDGSTLPIYVQPDGVEKDPIELIARAFDAARFQPGVEHIERYCREGRVAVCVDGIDQLNSEARTELLDAVDAFSRRFPRVRLIALTRAMRDDRMTMFARAEMAPLPDRALETLFELHGRPGVVVDRDVPDEIVDLARRPFFAGALATTGLDAETGLVVVQRLVERRLGAVVESDQSRLKLRFVAGELAKAARPATTIDLATAYEVVASALGAHDVTRLFEAEPAEALIDRIRMTGLASVDHAQLQLVHPLVATLLAAEAIVVREELPQILADDWELVAFVTALLPEARDSDIVDALASTDIFTIARALRLRPTVARRARVDRDAERYLEARRRFDALHSDCRGLAGFAFMSADEDGWLCARERTQEGVEVVTAVADFDQWNMPGTTGVTEFTMWPTNPFSSRLPVFVAAADSVLGFKVRAHQLLAIDPSDEFKAMVEPEQDLSALDEGALEGFLVAYFREYRDSLRTLARSAGLDSSSEISVPRGEPKIHLWERGADGVWVQVQWSDGAAEVGSKGPKMIGGSAVPLNGLGTPVLRAKGALRADLERALGSPLDSTSSLRPHMLAGWSW